MKPIIQFFAGVFLTVIFSNMAYANLDITCVAESCLTEGWVVYDMRTGNSSTSICVANDCSKNGWRGIYKGQVSSEIICKEGGCFEQGWRAYDFNRRLVADVSCQNSFAGSSCLKYGWVTYEPGRGSYLTQCVNGDCENIGWDVIVNGYAPQAVRCKEGGCFTIGWTLYQ